MWIGTGPFFSHCFASMWLKLLEDWRTSVLNVRASDWVCFHFSISEEVLHWHDILIEGVTIQTCVQKDCRELSSNGTPHLNLLMICILSDWWCGSVQWFVPWEGPCRCYCYRQQLRYNCAWMQDTGIYWIQGGVFSIRAQWNTFSASRVAWWATAKGALAV